MGGRSQQWVFRRGLGVTIDGQAVPVSSASAGVVDLVNGDGFPNPDGPWTVRAPAWARAWRFDGCSAGAGGGADTGTVGGGGGCSGLAALGVVKPCLPGGLLTVRVGAGAARNAIADGRFSATAVSGALGSVCLGLGTGHDSTPVRTRVSNVPYPGTASGAGGGWDSPGRSAVLGGAPGVAANNTPAGIGQVVAVGRWHGSAVTTTEATAFVSGASTAPRMPTEDLARQADLVTVMGGMGGAVAAFGEHRWVFPGAGVIVSNGVAGHVVGGLGGLCLPFTNLATLPEVPWSLGLTLGEVRPPWVSWWSDAGAGYGRGGIGDSVGLDDGTPGGDGVAIVTFLENQP